MKTGSLIGLCFGLLWWVAGAGAVKGPPGTALQAFGVLIFIAASIWVFRRKPQSVPGRPRWAYYIAAIVAEIVAIFLAQAWLSAKGLMSLIFPVVGVIVGLHFTGLWPAFGRRRFLVLAGAMTAINLFAIFLPLAPDTRLMLSGLGSSICLPRNGAVAVRIGFLSDAIVN